jgi:transcriptional regulator with XRE-family HTH domain
MRTVERTRGYLIRLYLARADMSSAEVGRTLDIDQHSVARYARGRGHAVALANLPGLADALGMSDQELGEYLRAEGAP